MKKVLIALFLLVVLISCKQKDSDQKLTIDMIYPNASDTYRSTILLMPENEFISSINLIGDRIYIDGIHYDFEKYNEDPENYKSTSIAYSCDLNGGDFRVEEPNANIRNYDKMEFIQKDDSKIVVEKKVTNDFFEYLKLWKYSADGELEFEIDLGRMLGAEPGTQMYQAGGVPTFQPTSAVQTPDGNIYVSVSRDIIALSSTGEKLFVIPCKGFSMLSLLSDGSLIAKYEERNVYHMSYVDVANQTIGEEIKFPEGFDMRGFEILMAPGFDIYIKNYEGLYGYNIGSEPVMVLDWVKAGLSGNTIENFTPITPQKYVCCNREYIFNRRELVILDMIPKIELKEKKVITIAQLGFVSPGSTFDYCVQQFNRRSEEYRIEVIDYAKYNLDGDMDRGAMLLNAAIAAGNIPDMFHWEVMGTNFPIYSYMEKGLFLDLYDVMDIDIVELARKPFEQNGKLYQLPMQIHFRTTVGKKANFPKTPLTPLELIDVFNSLESDQYLFLFDIKNQLINPRTILDFIDTKNRKVYFDSEDFIEFIKFVKEHGEVRALGRYSFDDYDIYRDDKVLLGTTSISSFDDIARFKYIFMEEFAFVGYPTLSDNGMYPMPMMSYGISSKTKYPEACWEFIKILLDDDLQYQIGIKQNKFPLTQNAMDKFIDYYLEIDYTIDDYKVELTREELENLLAYCTSSKAYNEMEYVTILNIINEEMSYDKTPEEIAKIIQSRVSIYINERY